MSTQVLGFIVVGLTALVVGALFVVMWRARTTPRQSAIAVASAVVLAAWASVVTALSLRGAFRQPDQLSFPPIGIQLLIVLAGLALCLAISRSLRGLLSQQRHLTLLHLWRLAGITFLFLMANGQMPALWALPAGIGDIIVGVAAPWVARQVETPQGKQRAVIFNLFGMADLIDAVGLGIMTSPGALQVFHTTPTSEFATTFPLVLVPAFLVPLAFVLHVASLWQLLRGTWAIKP